MTAPSVTGFAFASTTGAPTVIAHENFTGTNGGVISGTSTDSGGFTWTAFGGTWSYDSNQAKASGSGADLLFNAGYHNGSVEAVFYRNGGTAFNPSVVINSNSTGSEKLFVNWDAASNGSLYLYKYISGTFTELVIVPNLYASPAAAPASVTVRLESPASSVLQVYLDGVVRITYTLTSGEQTTFKNASHQYAGLRLPSDTTSSIDNFHFDV